MAEFRRARGRVTAIDTHWIWQEGIERLTKAPPAIIGDDVMVPHAPGLGIEIDLAAVKAAHAADRRIGGGMRDDALAMQYLVTAWTCDPKKPRLGRSPTSASAAPQPPAARAAPAGQGPCSTHWR